MSKVSHFRLVLIGIGSKTSLQMGDMQGTGGKSWTRCLQSSTGPSGLKGGYFRIRNMCFGNVPIFCVGFSIIMSHVLPYLVKYFFNISDKLQQN